MTYPAASPWFAMCSRSCEVMDLILHKRAVERYRWTRAEHTYGASRSGWSVSCPGTVTTLLGVCLAAGRWTVEFLARIR